MQTQSVLFILYLLCGSLAVSVRQHRGLERQAESLRPTEQSQGVLDGEVPLSLLEVGVGAEASSQVAVAAKLDVLRSVFPDAVVTSGQHKNAQLLAVEATGPPPLTPNWGIVSDSFGKGRLNLDFEKPTLANSIAIINGQGCYYGCSEFRLYGSNQQGDFSNFLYPGISSSMYPLGMYQPDQWAQATAKCDAASAAQFNPTEQVIPLADSELSKITKAGGFRYYIFLFDDTYGSVNPAFPNYFAIKHIAIQSPRRVPEAFPFYKFVFTQTRTQANLDTSGSESNSIAPDQQTPIQIAEVRMWTDLRWVAPIDGGTLNPGGYTTTNFEAKRATDNLPETAWRDNNMRGQASELWLIFNAKTSFTFYEFITAVDEPNMDPSSWILYGSYDTHAWTQLDVVNKFTMPMGRKVSQKFEINFLDYPTPVYVGSTGVLLVDPFLSYTYDPQPGVPGTEMYKDGSNTFLRDTKTVVDDVTHIDEFMVGWPSTIDTPKVTFTFGQSGGLPYSIIRLTIGYITFKDYLIGPPNAVLLEVRYGNSATWSMPTRWGVVPGPRMRELIEIPLPRKDVSSIRLTFIPGTFTFTDGKVANKFAIDEVTFYTAPNPCASKPCSNGDCSATRDQFMCTCSTGYQGTTCTQPIDRCATFPQPCLNGGTCVFQAPPTLYSCTCAPGYEGSNCEEELNPCASRPCGINGTCSKIGFNQFKCTCNPGYIGDRCVPQATVEGQIPVDDLNRLFNLLDVRVDKMETEGDRLLAAKIKLEKQRAQILAQGRETYRNILGIEQAPSVDPNNPPGAFETIAASLYGAGGGPNGGFNFPSPGLDSLLGGDPSYYPEIADPIYGTDPNGVGPGVDSAINPYEAASDPQSLISLYTQKPATYANLNGLDGGVANAQVIDAATRLADSMAPSNAANFVHDANREFPLQTPGVAFAAGPLFNQPYSGGPASVAGIGGPGANTPPFTVSTPKTPVVSGDADSLNIMIKNLEDQLKVPNTVIRWPNVGLLETKSSVHRTPSSPASEAEEATLIQQLLAGQGEPANEAESSPLASSQRSLLSLKKLDIFEDDEILQPELSPEEKQVLFRLKQAQIAEEKHRLAVNNLQQLEKKIANLQSKMEQIAPPVQEQEENYITALLTLDTQVKQKDTQKKEEMSVEELNGLGVDANRPFPLSGHQKFLAQYQAAFPGLDDEVVPVVKLAKTRAGLTPQTPQTTSASPNTALLQSTDSSTPSPPTPTPEEQRQQLQRTLQTLLQTREKMLEEQRQKQMKAELDSLAPKQQEQVVRGELMKLMGELGAASKGSEESEVQLEDNGSLAEVGGQVQQSAALPGLGAIDVLAASESDSSDPQLADLASIAESLEARLPPPGTEHPTPAQQAAAQALKRTKELNYLESSLNLLDPEHKMGNLPPETDSS